MSKQKKWQVGQSVYVVPVYSDAHDAVVRKVGRKWVTLDSGARFDAQTGIVDWMTGSEGAVYALRSEYRRKRERERTWWLLRVATARDVPPEHLSDGDLARISRELRGDKHG